MKQTAVEWFFEKVMITHPDNLDELLEQAKTMEKDEQKNTFVEGMYKGQELYFGEHRIKLDVNSLNYSLDIAEQYYNETFKS